MAISNSGSNEKGGVYGGQPGDQTGNEWAIRSWYNRPWNRILRHPDAKVREMIAADAEKAAKNDKIGYNQLNRDSFEKQLKAAGDDPAKITVACDADCSAGVIAITRAVGRKLGISKLANLKATYTGNMRSGFKTTGFQELTASKYLTSDAYLLRGDILLNDKAHTAINLTNGSKSGAQSAKTSTSGCPYSEPSGQYVQVGTIGNGAKWVQWHLKRLGYDIGGSGIDGIVGKNTAAAIRKFQKAKKLEVDGIVGPMTRAALKAAK